MKINSLIDFIAPNFSDAIQASFIAAFLFLISATIISTHWAAREKSWEKKWNRNNGHGKNDGLDVEHGSVTDLSNAIATAPEKIAEIMPSMLLVLGLLGTFVGLGMALNNASALMNQADLNNAGSMADNIGQLTSMLQGLGTKFKTSTWGIMGFISLALWRESVRFDEKRLAWVISKVKIQLDKKKAEQSSREDFLRQELYRNINLAAQFIGSESMKGSRILSKNIADSHTLLEGIKGEMASMKDLLNNGFQALSGELNQLGASQNKFNERSLIAYKDNSELMSAGFLGLRSDIQENNASMQKFTTEIPPVIASMAAGAQQVGEAATRMQQGATDIAGASQGLVGAVGEFEKQFTSVLGDIRDDLGSAIKEMSADASKTLQKGSVQMSAATKEISSALAVLSDDVKATMAQVKNSIENAEEMQKKTSMEFTLSSKALHEAMAETTNLVENLGEPIKDGLKSVSDVGRRMDSIAKKLDKSLATLEALVQPIGEIPKALNSISGMDENLEKLAAIPPALDAILMQLKPKSA